MDKNWKVIKLNIDGMTCINCQTRIEEALQRCEGIIEVTVDFAKGRAVIVCEETVTRESLVSAVQAEGYRVLAPTEDVSRKLIFTGAMLVLILILFDFLESFGILNLLVPTQLADSGMGYGMIFVVGLLTSVHCIAMCGGINLSQCLPTKVEEGGERTTKQAILPAILYNVGRVISYTFIGLVMGLIGFAIGGGNAGVGIPVLLQGILKLVAGLLMLVMGLNMLGIFPWLRKIVPHMPASLAKKINRKKREGGSSFVVGILNGIMPCGPLQSMWLVALATGNPFAGALSMLLFALGTVPLMLGLGALVGKLGQKFAKSVMTVGSVLVAVMGLAMLSQGGSLTGWISPVSLFVLLIVLFAAGFLLCLPMRGTAGKVALRSCAIVMSLVTAYLCFFQSNLFLVKTGGDIAVVEGDIQTVTSTLSRSKYPEITVQEGIPVKWIINAPEGSISGCNYEIIIQALGITYDFEEGENIIEFTPEEVGTINYNCWMGMIHGKIHVVAA